MDLCRGASGGLHIRPAVAHSVHGPAQHTIPRISLGRRALDAWGLAHGYYDARMFRDGIALGARRED